jgi:DNA-binding MarR family transcriptional regulator
MTACACEGLRRTARTVTRQYEKALAPSGLKATQFPIVIALAAAGPLPVSVLAAALALDRTTLTRNLKGLVAQGVVEFAPDDDRRVRVVRLTGEGGQALRRALPLWRQVQATVEAQFGQPRLHDLMAELSELTNLCRD